MADFLANMLAKAAVMLVESLVKWIFQSVFATAFAPSDETAAAFA
ncbi:hypothetical protein [Phytohabitans kaempferiae]|uniref:Uncharacterized protein n=1 Tax=Phytohabitans kaempferiae TaxID=1620943 RepID=A0ABV6MBY5_9ACTN